MDLPTMFLLVATKDRTGRPMGYHHYGFGAAVLGEMVLRGHLRIDRKRVIPVDVPEDPLLATVYHDVTARKAKKASWWVSKLSGGKYRLLRRQFTQRLVDEGTLTPVKGFFGYRYPSNDVGPERRLRERIEQAVATDDASDSRLTCLIALAVSAGSAKELHPDRHVRRQIARAGKRWARSDDLARAVQELIAAITAAVVAASVAASAG